MVYIMKVTSLLWMGNVYWDCGNDPLGQGYTQGTHKFSSWLMFWGAFSRHGKSELVLVSQQSGECVNKRQVPGHHFCPVLYTI